MLAPQHAWWMRRKSSFDLIVQRQSIDSNDLILRYRNEDAGCHSRKTARVSSHATPTFGGICFPD